MRKKFKFLSDDQQLNDYFSKQYDNDDFLNTDSNLYNYNQNIDVKSSIVSDGINLEVGSSTLFFFSGLSELTYTTYLGGNSSDVIIADKKSDYTIIDAGDGNNLIFSDTLSDYTVFSGNGNDFVRINSPAYYSSIATSGGDDIILNNSGYAYINTGEGNDSVYDGDGSSFIDAGSGQNAIYAGAGDDVVDVSMGTNYADGGDGIDTLSIISYNSYNILNTQQNPETLVIDINAKQIFGGVNNISSNVFNFENINVYSDSDVTIKGSEGDNIISAYGNEGNFDITGGGGNDVFSFSGFYSNATYNITDFEMGKDTINLYTESGMDITKTTEIDEDGNHILSIKASQTMYLLGFENEDITYNFDTTLNIYVTKDSFTNFDDLSSSVLIG